MTRFDLEPSSGHQGQALPDTSHPGHLHGLAGVHGSRLLALATPPFTEGRGGASGVGKVWLVGAGPGDPELITVRGLRCLRRADVVVYDRLVHPALVDEAPEWAERVFVGKARGVHVKRQEEINEILVARAQAGLEVVRLKGGDPFVFGRGGEEAAALAAAGLEWEEVPGISSAVAAPARAAIPVTHRGVAAAFAVVTGHLAPDGSTEPDWRSLAGIDTLVILMGLLNLSRIADRLVEHGRAADTPVAVIERASLADERVITGTLATIAERVAEARVRAPSTVVVGEVVRLRESLTATVRYAAIESFA